MSTTDATTATAVQLRTVPVSAIAPIEGWNPRLGFDDVTARYLQAGEIHVDPAARSVNVAGSVVHLSRRRAGPRLQQARARSLHLAAAERGAHRRQPHRQAAQPPHPGRRRLGPRQQMGQGWSLTGPQRLRRSLHSAASPTPCAAGNPGHRRQYVSATKPPTRRPSERLARTMTQT